MSEYDLHSNIDTRHGLITFTVSSDFNVNGEIIDTIGFESLEYVVYTSGLIIGGTYTISLMEGDIANLGDASFVSIGETLGDLPVFTSSESFQVKRVGSIGKKRYQRMTMVGSGVTGTPIFGVIAILGSPHVSPIP